MNASFAKWFSPPEHQKDEQAQQLLLILWTMILTISSTMIVCIVLMPAAILRFLGFLILADAVCLGLISIARQGRTQLVSILFVVIQCLIIPLYALNSGGIRAPIIYSYPLVVFIAGLLLGTRAGLITAVVASLTGFGLVLAGRWNLLPPVLFQHSDFVLWAVISLLLWVTVGLQYIAVNSIQNSLRQSRQELADRRLAEAALRKSEERYRRMVETTNEAIIVLDRESCLTLVNQPVADLLGYSREELLGQTIERLIFPEDMDDYLAQKENRERGRSAVFERRLCRKDGEAVWVLVSATPLIDEDGHFYGSFGMITNINERKQHESELQAITDLSAALRTAPTRSQILSVLVEQVSCLLRVDAISAQIIDPLSGDAVTEAAYGDWSLALGLRQPPGTGLNAAIDKTRRPYHANRVELEANPMAPGFPQNEIQSVAGMPLIAHEHLIGYLWVGRRKTIALSEVRLFTAAANIAANAIHRATLHEQTQRDAANLALAYDVTLEGWAQALELRDQETEGHARRVVQMTVDLARWMGLGDTELEQVRRGALLHDIGKMGIPDSILFKPGALDEQEWAIMRLHPVYAYQLLQKIEYLRPVLDIPYCHHERWDGAGYPRGLTGEQIPLVARIFAIVDVWDALTSDRMYRKAWSEEQALQYIQEQAGQHFDPAVVDAFLALRGSREQPPKT